MFSVNTGDIFRDNYLRHIQINLPFWSELFTNENLTIMMDKGYRNITYGGNSFYEDLKYFVLNYLSRELKIIK